MLRLYKILCFFGIHHWVHGNGWIELDKANSMYFDGFRCSTCGEIKE